MILNTQQQEQFGANGFIVIPDFISKNCLVSIQQTIDSLQGETPFKANGRWDLRDCFSKGEQFADVATDTALLTVVTQLLGWNIKLLGSHIVKMNIGIEDTKIPVRWHRDGGMLLAELPDPLPQMFVKVSICVSGSSHDESGELMVVPGSHRLIGAPANDPKTGMPVGSSSVWIKPGDLLIFDWRLWHAVNRNKSEVIRRTLYFAFGFRWLMPIDSQKIPEQLMISPIHKQIFGSSTELGNYLPSEEEVPLKVFLEKINGGDTDGL
jgi:hypothetical protein